MSKLTITYGEETVIVTVTEKTLNSKISDSVDLLLGDYNPSGDGVILLGMSIEDGLVDVSYRINEKEMNMSYKGGLSAHELAVVFMDKH